MNDMFVLLGMGLFIGVSFRLYNESKTNWIGIAKFMGLSILSGVFISFIIGAIFNLNPYQIGQNTWLFSGIVSYLIYANKIKKNKK